MRKISSALAVLLLASAIALAAPGAGSATPSYCGITWGSLDTSAPWMSQGPVVGVRSGRHLCFDRLVVDVAGPAPGYHVAYVPVVHQDGSGLPVWLRGGAFLQVTVHSPAYSQWGVPTYWPANRAELVDTYGYSTFRQVAWAGSFEGHTTLGLGVRARLPYRVFTLPDTGWGSRVVVDVAHYW